MFSPDDFSEIDAGQYVVREQARFFGSGSFNAAEAAGAIVADAISCGASHVAVDIEAAWTLIIADVDWLDGRAASAFTELGSQFGGPNAFSMEFVVTVLASRVFTLTAAGLEIIKGSTSDIPALPDFKGGRSLGFMI